MFSGEETRMLDLGRDIYKTNQKVGKTLAKDVRATLSYQTYNLRHNHWDSGRSFPLQC